LREANLALTQNLRIKAAGLFRDAILADPTLAAAYEGIARSLLTEGNYPLVEASLETALDLDPGMDRARFDLGAVAQMQGDYDRAVETWGALAALQPDYPEVYARMAIAAYYDQDFEAARSYLSEADKRKQNVPPQFRDLLRKAGNRP
jgi:tetratricopeptide (TPR) repeat protein